MGDDRLDEDDEEDEDEEWLAAFCMALIVRVEEEDWRQWTRYRGAPMPGEQRGGQMALTAGLTNPLDDDVARPVIVGV